MAPFHRRDLDEDLRLALEARSRSNEIHVNRIRLVFLTGLLMLHSASYVRPFAPFPITVPMLTYESLALALAVFFHVRLRGPARAPSPIAFAAFDVVAFTGFAFLHLLPIDLATALYLPAMFYLVLVGVSTLRFSPAAVLVSGAGGLVGFAAYFALKAGPSIQLGPPIVALAVATTAAHLSSRSLLSLFLEVNRKARLERFLSPDVVAEIGEREELLGLSGTRRRVTILFCDIRGFTGLSERLDPSQVVDLLNTYLGSMTEVVFQFAGTLDKFLGDGIMAVFGAPVARADDSDRAVDAALGMLGALAGYNDQRRSRGEEPLRVGIGIHTGDVIAGTVGSPRRMDYTVIGDTVNVASRVESLTRKFGVDLIVTEETRRSLSRSRTLRPLGDENVKGRLAPVTVFAVEPA